MMAAIIYGLCALLSMAIAWLLWRQHARTRSRMAFWSAWCFTGLAVNNLVLVFDKLLLPGGDLQLLRHLIALVAVCVLLFGLVYEDE